MYRLAISYYVKEVIICILESKHGETVRDYTLPKHILEEAQIDVGDDLNLFAGNGKMVMEPLHQVDFKKKGLCFSA
ncbi:MAG: AbrB/MazE/SpoVT family DNA-binding domain-containing protein [candidate division KSB1 bacterium]|nr:AbrB/MazE/SpoVT family DNA-binding domain-containing protein [candidate division KSB1 bacterium]